ncbi:indolepyruvate oxidoreductase subunit beta [Natranaerobius trueperi]|uniref:Indolepyruvate oxidoreductase subunit beta n=1 Tax=Natranaerobius trueperi TaxID=759412 RepID=A0A226BYG3_9FIRM|nr:indolepyruvate oxidoreductase subunit beta [Natranaerobius trueperi]OWZ83180.1 indolepyruvate oxidoreductase subunit beta [Natranaerobius trueperi]
MNNTNNIMIVGVGGQGVLLASELICEALLLKGYDVKKSEVHGMAQRGGSVVTNVRFAEQVYSPLITEGEADFLLSFEQMETLRWLDYIHSNTRIIVNEQQIVPMPVATGHGSYPPNAIGNLKEVTDKVTALNALNVAKEAGNIKTVNVILVGALSKYLDIPEEHWKEIIQKRVPPKTLEANLKAFDLGRNS